MRSQIKFKALRVAFCLSALCYVSVLANAIDREDVLECGLTDDSKFVLTSSYQYSLIPVPLRHATRETDRKSWNVKYFDRAGKVSNVPTSVMFRNLEIKELSEVCAHFAMSGGILLAPFTYLQNNGSCFSLDGFYREKLHVDVLARPDSPTPAQFAVMDPDPLNPALRAVMTKAGIRGSTNQFAFIYLKDRQLIYEQPLYRTANGYLYDKNFDAVYQSLSSDGGKTWSEPTVTNDAKIFEIGKSWLKQSFIAHPTKINGKPINVEFKAAITSRK
jgi:hypothetical protein